ncbi:Transcription initiation factor TFIID subunit 10 [Linnemannia schmuckeri]|uniref:Transcription initiation factor TFIID subunit 10 n=1 Tax=Linnemannia schmuckeri TaxID=64567 RepID=A0A9P5RSZ4_9FUNG|nr:Transcription initiation factor TFIID subunit 10 [Linnemannia schmuckeri]
MSEGSNSSHSTIEDTNMASPMQTASGTSTPAIHSSSEVDTNMTPAVPMDQDTPTPQHSQSQGPSSAVASPVLPSTAQQLQPQQQPSTPPQQQQQTQDAATPAPSAPSTPASAPVPGTVVTPTIPATEQFSAASPMTGVISTSSPAPSAAVSPIPASATVAAPAPAITAPITAPTSVSVAPAATAPAPAQQQPAPSIITSGSIPTLSTPPPVVVTASTPAAAPTSTPAAAATQTSQQEELQRQQQHQQQLLLLQKQAQQAHIAQLQRAQETQAAANANAHVIVAPAAANTAAATPTPAATVVAPTTAAVNPALATLGSVAQRSQAVGAALQSRKEEELSRKDRTLAEFLPMMETYNPIIPDAVTDYYLSRTGFDCDDVRIKRLLALAAQKFVSDIATDAFQYCKVRQQSQKRPAPGKEKKTVLTMEDLSDALGEYGINVKKPDYFM